MDNKQKKNLSENSTNDSISKQQDDAVNVLDSSDIVFEESLSEHLDYCYSNYIRENTLMTSLPSPEDTGSLCTGGEQKLKIRTLDMEMLLKYHQSNIISAMREEINKTLENQFSAQNQKLDQLAKENCSAISELVEKIDSITNRMQKIETVHENIKTDIVDLKLCQSTITKDFDESNLKIKQLQMNLRDTDELCICLKKEIQSLTKHLNKIESKQNDLEQYDRRLNLILNGIPITPNEDPFLIKKNIAKKINVQLCDTDISAAHRLATTSDSYTLGIIVRFCRMNKRDEIYKNKANLSKEKQGNEIFITENLTEYYQQLFKQTRQLKKERNYKYAWTYHPSL